MFYHLNFKHINCQNYYILANIKIKMLLLYTPRMKNIFDDHEIIRLRILIIIIGEKTVI